jgi:hypothetical protein
VSSHYDQDDDYFEGFFSSDFWFSKIFFWSVNCLMNQIRKTFDNFSRKTLCFRFDSSQKCNWKKRWREHLRALLGKWLDCLDWIIYFFWFVFVLSNIHIFNRIYLWTVYCVLLSS